MDKENYNIFPVLTQSGNEATTQKNNFMLLSWFFLRFLILLGARYLICIYLSKQSLMVWRGYKGEN